MGQESSVESATRDIEKAEQQEAQATLKNDLPALEALWSENLIVSSTANLVLTKGQAMTLFRAGRIRLKSFERRISRVQIIGEIAIATGNETFTAKDDLVSNSLFICSYMNIWMREEGGWKLIGRHVGLMTTIIGGAKARQSTPPA